MIQASTSLIFSRALTSPGMAPQAAPARMPDRNASSQTTGAGTTVEGMLSATTSVAAVPIRYCPGAPMLNRPVLNATATESPVRISGVARNSILPTLVGLKPKVRLPTASRPVLRIPPSTSRMPSQAAAAPIPGLVRPTTSTITQPTSKPMRMDSSEATTVFAPSFCIRADHFSFMRCALPSPCAWRRPYTGPAPGHPSASDQTHPRSRPHTSPGCGRTGSLPRPVPG